MEYKGKLYGKVGDIYFELLETSEDVDRLKEQNEKLLSAIKGIIPMAEFSYEHSKKACAHQEFLSDDRDALYAAREAIKSCQP
jgi:nucleoid-associated protein YejK